MRRNWLLCLALTAAIAGLFYGVFAGALWAPHEVSVAEQARRIAVNLFGGETLALPGVDNTLPIRADLGRGELPFTSAALGLRLFGLSAWAGRLPLAIWALAGLTALYAALARLCDRRLAVYAVLVLATTPLFFLQARTLLGDAVTLASFALSWSGLSVACLGERVSSRARAWFAVLGVAGAYAGFWCRGPIVGVAVPMLAVGITGLVHRPRVAAARWMTLAACVVGVLALALGASGIAFAERTGQYSVLVGTALVTPAILPTFDVGSGDLAHAAFPWSAAAPLALALLFAPGGASRSQAVIHAAALGLGLSLAATAWLAPTVGQMLLPGVSGFAVLVAAALRALEAGRLGSPLLGLVCAALAVVIGFDLRENPDKSLAGFGLRGAPLPESLQSAAGSLWLVGACCIGVVTAYCLYESGPEKRARLFEPEQYARALSGLKQAYGGNLVFAWLLLEAALLGFLLLCALGERLISLPQLESFGSFSRRLAALGAIALPLTPFGIVASLLLRDVTRWAVRGALGVTRAQAVLLAFATLGLVASLGFYPALARQVSPTHAIERYRSLRRAGERLGVLGELSGAARYQGVPDAESFDQSDVAFEWLTENAPRRRFLALRQSDLPELNAQHRALRHKNLPILEGASQVLLGVSSLRPPERSENPLDALVLDAPPAIQHPLAAVLDEQLEVLGWSLRSASGELESSVLPARGSLLSVYYRVLAPLSEDDWDAFVHIDGFQRRFNADHPPLAGKYPLRLWRPGDILVDTTEVKLEPNFSPGPYRLYLGLFSGDRRLKVSQGSESDDRVEAGVLQVR